VKQCLEDIDEYVINEGCCSRYKIKTGNHQRDDCLFSFCEPFIVSSLAEF
jgi:hypothetical protein